ncbi:hypothetical protein K488DRAFT_89818, partial [Vararia minispora EC-137]
MDALIVPTILPSGALHFASVSPAGTVQDVLDALAALDDVRLDVLGDLLPRSWAVQRIRSEQSGRQWEEDELDALGDGLVPPSSAVAPLIQSAPDPAAARHFSAFALTSHLHTPALRLVSLHPALSPRFIFLRVPEIHDGFVYTFFVARNTTVHDVILGVVDELGLTRSLPVPGAGALQYAIEDVWSERDVEKSTRLAPSSVLSSALLTPERPAGFSLHATHTLRFCVPDEWYRRSRERSSSSARSIEPSDATIKALQAMEADDDDEYGTAKQTVSPATSTVSRRNAGVVASSVASSSGNGSGDWRATISQTRLSSMFTGWLSPSDEPAHPPPAPAPAPAPGFAPQRMSVSAPTLVDLAASAESEPDAGAFEAMLDDLGLSGKPRERMYNLPPARRRQLLEQHVQTQPAPATFGPSARATVLPRLVPQLTGGDLMKRLSTWGASPPADKAEFAARRRMSGQQHEQPVAPPETEPPLQAQTTGSRWAGWWYSSGGSGPSSSSSSTASTIGRAAGKDAAAKTPASYVAQIRSARPVDARLVKHLISLRVHLSTASVPWLRDFIDDARGLSALGDLLASLVRRPRRPTDMESSALLELVKSVRVLLNTEPGFDAALAQPALLTHTTYALHNSPPKLRALVCDVLAGVAVLSQPHGHRAVLSALSDFRVAFDEPFRFEGIVAALRAPDGEAAEEDAAEEWEARTAGMMLVNALAGGPEALEERVMMREEFGRRGLNEVIVTLRYVRPPEALVKQLDVYTEDKFEDEEDMRERAARLVRSGHARDASDGEAALDELRRVARAEPDVYAGVVALVGALLGVVQSEADVAFKTTVMALLAAMAEQGAGDGVADGGWKAFFKAFLGAAQSVTGEALDASGLGGDTVVEQELKSLHGQIEMLTAERAALREQVEQQAAEISTLRSLPTGPPVPQAKKAGAENLHGLVQRLVQKEKQALQLQAELDRYKAQNPESREADERARRERDKTKWTTLMEEISKLKVQAKEHEAAMAIKDKELLFLKRALESVYSRFRSREESRDAEEFDAQTMATRAIESLTQKDNEALVLQAEIADLRAQLAAKPKFVTEKDYKSSVPPPPPPPGLKARSNSVVSLRKAPPPPPPPPPPMSPTSPSTS